MRRWSDLLCAFPNAATAGAENATINAKARRSLLMMVSFYDVNFHAWIIKGDSMEARLIPITGFAARSLSRVTLHESRNGWPYKIPLSTPASGTTDPGCPGGS
jgi:hypothetical protein